MNSFYTRNLMAQPSVNDLGCEVLTNERLEEHFSSMDVAEQNQIRMIAHMNRASINSIVELMILKGREKIAESGESVSMPLFSLVQ